MELNFADAKRFFDLNDLTKSIEILDVCIASDSADLQSLLLRGRIHHKMQKWGNAMNDYSTVLELQPDHPEAKTGLELCRNILGYFNPDMFNP